MANVDTRLIAKPPFFSGNVADWDAWKFHITNYMGLVDDEYIDLLELAGTRVNIIAMPADPLIKQKARTLFGILVSLFGSSSKCMSLARNNMDRNGFELWRGMTVEFEPATSTRSLGMLDEIINFDFGSDLPTFEDRFAHWLTQINMFEFNFKKRSTTT